MSNGNGKDNELVETIEIAEGDGRIVVWFGEKYAILSPEQSMGIGEMLMRYGHHALTGEEQSGQATMSAQIVRKLENTVAAALADMGHERKTPMYMAERVVDICLKEVL